ncbi:RNA pseudouridine synthase, partial [bacterium M00.F.Ca.ET.229.01.1.1]
MSAHNEEAPILIGDELTEGEAVVLEAGTDAAGQRLDQWLAARLGPDISRSRVQAL